MPFVHGHDPFGSPTTNKQPFASALNWRGISLLEAARRAVREFVNRSDHRDRVADATARILVAHQDALRRLGE